MVSVFYVGIVINSFFVFLLMKIIIDEFVMDLNVVKLFVCVVEICSFI